MGTTKRIEYIDAQRGFVMMLVVLGHVPMYCYHHLDGISFSTILTIFHIASFFFISGWFVNSGAVRNAKQASLRNGASSYDTLRYDTARGAYDTQRSCYDGVYGFLKRKFGQLVVPTVVFYLLFCWMNNIDIIENLWSDKFKAGYWFCTVLFIFYGLVYGLQFTVDGLHVKKTKTEDALPSLTLVNLLFSLLLLFLNTNTVTDILAKHHP